MLHARYPGVTGYFRAVDGAATGVRRSLAHLWGRFHAGPGLLLKLVVAPLLPHDLAHVQAVHPS
jgi:hypothetical protein